MSPMRRQDNQDSPDSPEKQLPFWGIQIRRFRKEKGLVQEDLEITMREDFHYALDRTNIGRIESGIREISGVEAGILACILGISTDELMWGTPNPTKEQILDVLQAYEEPFAKQRTRQQNKANH